MDNFEYTFINAKHDEDFFTDLLNTTFQDDYGYSLHDCNNHYSGYHSTLVCKHNAMIIGGISVYFQIHSEQANCRWNGGVLI
jgi:hypothetical protein